MAVTADAMIQAELEQLLDQLRLVAPDTELAPGELMTPSVLGLEDRPPDVQARVDWSVLGSDRTPLPAAEVSAPRGLQGEQIELRLRPDLVERRAQPAPVARRVIRATVTVSVQRDPAQPPLAATRELDVELSVLPLAVPSALALFRNPGFLANTPKEGCALVVVPVSSPLASIGALRTALADLQLQLDRLSAFAALSTLRTRLATLTGALAKHDPDNMKLRRADALANLNEITLIQNGPLTNDIEAEDELSSAILLGAEGRTARCYVRRQFDAGAGELIVETGAEGIVLVNTLHSRVPATVPGRRVRVPTAPAGSRTFGDELSSLRLVPPRFRCRLRGVATLTIDHPAAGGPKTVDVNVGLGFSDDRRTVFVEDFAPIVTPDGTISKVGEAQGTFDPATGSMTLAVRLELAVGGFVGSPEIGLPLTTGSAARGVFSETGQPLNRLLGRITLVAVGEFEGGPLGGSDASLVIAGELDPIP